jgi:MFS family permease
MLLAGSSVSMLGSRVTTIAYPMLVLYLTRSPLAAGLVGFAATAPSILVYIPAGALVDRWDPWRAMLFCECGRGLAIGTVVAAIALGRPSVAMLAVLAVIEESLEVFSNLAERRYVRSLVELNQVRAALVRSEARTHLVVLIGRPLGGFLFGLGRILPFGVDVLSFAISAGVLVRIRKDRVVRCGGPGRDTGTSRQKHTMAARLPGIFDWRRNRPLRAAVRQLVNEMLAGVRYMRDDSFTRTVVPLAACTTLIAQALVMFFFVEARAENLSPVIVGLALASPGVGGVLGSRAATWVGHLPGFPWLRLQMYLWSAALLVLTLCDHGQSIFFMSMAMFVFGFTGAMGNIALNTRLTRSGDNGMLARVFSIYTLMVFSASAIGSALGGILAEYTGIEWGVIILLLMTVALAGLCRTFSAEDGSISEALRCLPVLCADTVLRPFKSCRPASERVQRVSMNNHPGQREDELAGEPVKPGPGEAGQRRAQGDRPVQRDPYGRGVGDDIGARRDAGYGAVLDALYEQGERLGAELQHGPAVLAD